MTSDGADTTESTDATGATDTPDVSNNHPVAAKIKNAIANKQNNTSVAPTTTPSSVAPSTTTTTSTTSTPATVTPAVASTAVPADGFKNIQSLDLDKMNSLLTKSKELMNELKTSFPGMSNILGGAM